MNQPKFEDKMRLFKKSIVDGDLLTFQNILDDGFKFLYYNIRKPTKIAFKRGHMQILKLLADYLLKMDVKNNKLNAFNLICWLGDEEMFNKFEAEYGIKDIYKNLSYPCKGGNLKIVEKMINLGANDW